MKKAKHCRTLESPSGRMQKVARMFMTLLLALAFLPVWAQTRHITGTVSDENDEPLVGATVKLTDNSKVVVVTDIDGKFALDATAKSKSLEVSYVGYETQKVNLTAASNYRIVLKESSHELETVVVIGYGSQKKATLTGAVSAIDGKEVAVTKSQDAKNMLTGKIPGVRVTQNTSEPGEFGYGNFDIRGYGGSPLIVVDGVPRGNLERIDPNEIESISVLKDASAAVYGARGGNGVILVTTKKGSEGRAKITYSMYYGIQTPAEVLRPVGAVDRMILSNEKSMRSLTDPRLTYTDEQMDAYRNGTLTSTDWYDAVMASSAPQQQHNISVSGGSKTVNYFINFGYMDQKGFLKSDDIDYNRYNFRSNLEATLLPGLVMNAKLGAIIDKRSRPYVDVWTIFGNLWRSVPDQSVYANGNPDYLQKPDQDIPNPVASMTKDQSGYKENQNKIFSSSFEARYDLPWVKGLQIRGMFSYDNTIRDNATWQQEYNEYTYDAATDTYTKYPKNGPNKLSRSYNNNWSTLWQAAVSYDNEFYDHHVGALLLYEETYSRGDDISASRFFTLQIPYLYAGDAENQVGNGGNLTEVARKALVGRVNYDYDGKYLFDFSFRYDGSSIFNKGHKWGFFPSVSAGWRISEEKFIKDNFDFVDNIKLRGSYGEMGDDSAANWQFISGYNYPNTSGGVYNNYPKGYVFGGEVVNSLGFRSAPNPNLTWYKIKTANIGLDFLLWRGLLGATFEIFQRDRSGLLANRNATVPGTFGSTLSQENLNSDRVRGFELELTHNNRIGDFTYYVKGNLSLTRAQRRYVERNPSGNSYADWTSTTNTNRYNDIWFGYTGNGRWESFEQIANSPTYGMGNGQNATLPGDYIYEDWNNDGVIDGNDKHPIATTISQGSEARDKRNFPLMNFGLTLGGTFRGFDLSMTFQGAGMSYVAYGDQLSSPLGWNGNALEYFLDRWHPTDPKADPYDPSNVWIPGEYAYGGKTPDLNSTFSIQKGDYLRLKTLEVGYTFPIKWTGVVGIQALRIYANAYNLFTITGVKGMDPEKPAQLYGQMYPLNRSYNFGLSVQF